VGKFQGAHDSKDGFHPANCRNDKERRVIEFILPILSPEKPKRLTITMANTLFGVMSGVRPVNWGRLIQEYVERNIPLQENGCKTYKILTLKCPNQQKVLDTMDFYQFTVVQIFLSIFLSIFVNIFVNFCEFF
jgi:hypothetical protein